MREKTRKLLEEKLKQNPVFMQQLQDRGSRGFAVTGNSWWNSDTCCRQRSIRIRELGAYTTKDGIEELYWKDFNTWYCSKCGGMLDDELEDVERYHDTV